MPISVRLTRAEQAILEDLRKSNEDSEKRGYDLHVGLLLTNRKTIEGIISGVDMDTSIVQLEVDNSDSQGPKLFKTSVKAIVGVYYWHFITVPAKNDLETWENHEQVPGLPE